MATAQGKATVQLSPGVREWLHVKKSMSPDASDETAAIMLTNAVLYGDLSHEELSSLGGSLVLGQPDCERPTQAKFYPRPLASVTAPTPVSQSSSRGAKPQEDSMSQVTTKAASPSRSEAFASIRVKGEYEKYSTKSYPVKHPKTGLQAIDHNGQEITTPSDLELAIIGSLFKSVAIRGGVPGVLTEHERGLLSDAIEMLPWCGHVGGDVWESGITGTRTKAILDDTTSGAIFLVPEIFDERVIQYPLLHSEVFPYVEIIDVPAGRRISTAAVNNPTVSWGTSEGTSITPYNTDNLVSQIQATEYPVVAALELGRDAVADSPIDIGRIVVENIGQSLLKDLDRVVVQGNGTSEPQGIFNASSTISAGAPSGGAGAAWAIGDIEALVFGIAKEYRNGVFGPCFVMNDVTYRRTR